VTVVGAALAAKAALGLGHRPAGEVAGAAGQGPWLVTSVRRPEEQVRMFFTGTAVRPGCMWRCRGAPYGQADAAGLGGRHAGGPLCRLLTAGARVAASTTTACVLRARRLSTYARGAELTRLDSGKCDPGGAARGAHGAGWFGAVLRGGVTFVRELTLSSVSLAQSYRQLLPSPLRGTLCGRRRPATGGA
jgi:hypothetical protein